MPDVPAGLRGLRGPRGLTVLAPLGGVVTAMADVPDPVFRAEIVGPGLAIDPPRSGVVAVVAPIAGTIVTMHPHAFVVSDNGHAMLVHLGLDTVQLAGVGFTPFAREGDVVAAGDLVVSWVPAEIEAGGRSPISPIVALEGAPGSVTPSAAVGTTIRAGDALFVWS